jgi:UTP--glucose-1-phosphate uridylyltransferase
VSGSDPWNSPPLAELTAAEASHLRDLAFDAETFSKLAALLAQDQLPPNPIDGIVSAPRPGAIRRIPPPGSWQGDALPDAGTQLLAGGRVALVLLNGGMATRFEGRVKGIVDALPGRSFLALQAQRLKRIGEQLGAPVPLLVMNSFATEGPTLAHLERSEWFGLDPDQVRLFRQSGAPRLGPDGRLHREADGSVSVYGPGHGDLLPSLRRTGALAWARERGVEYLLMANVDNLAADLDVRLLGAFAAWGSEMMVEAAPKAPEDVGGAPADVDGRTVIVESFAFPPGFDHASLPVFNTNTLWFRADAIDRDIPLRWYCVRKRVEDKTVVQFERLVGQASWFLDTAFVEVPRARFLPIKRPADLDAARPTLRAMFGMGLNVLNGVR